MLLLDRPIAELTARDLMSMNVVHIPTGMTLRGAARLLRSAGISGAPVVDHEGKCVGVLSNSDFLKTACGDPAEVAASACVCSEWQVMEIDVIIEDLVENRMTRDPVTVRPDTSLPELARTMLDVHIHRVIVVDDEAHPIGIVSSTDVLAAVARQTG